MGFTCIDLLVPLLSLHTPAAEHEGAGQQPDPLLRVLLTLLLRVPRDAGQEAGAALWTLQVQAAHVGLSEEM